ncbi:MAG: YfiT family bacillithiol transferase [Bacteroidota bacterium]
MDAFHLRYPIGKFKEPESYDAAFRNKAIREIKAFPSKLKSQLLKLSSQELEQAYRPGGWNGRQVVHHVADSHMNAYTRFKLAMTESIPVIKPYNEAEWAVLSDTAMDIEVSVQLLKALHSRWAHFLESLSEASLKRSFRHPETGTIWNLDFALAQYDWHGNHHLGHLRLLEK